MSSPPPTAEILLPTMHMPRHYRTTTTTTTGPSRAGERGGGSPADCVFLHGN